MRAGSGPVCGLRRPTGDAHAAARAGAAPARTERYKIARESSSPERAAWVRAPWSWVGCWGSVHAARAPLRAALAQSEPATSGRMQSRNEDEPDRRPPARTLEPDRTAGSGD
jgi:hypothetical protein